MEQARTIEQRIKDVDALLKPYDDERRKQAAWGGYMHITEAELDLLNAREHLFTELYRSKTP